MWYKDLESVQKALRAKSFCLASSSEEDVKELLSNLTSFSCKYKDCSEEECIKAPFLYIDENLNITVGYDAREFYSDNNPSCMLGYGVREFDKIRTFIGEKSIDCRILDKESEGKLAYLVVKNGNRGIIRISRKNKSLLCCSERLDLSREPLQFEKSNFWFSSSKVDDSKVVVAKFIDESEIEQIIKDTQRLRL